MTRKHEHRWELIDDEQPVFEDGAAIFYETCTWQPTKMKADYSRDETYTVPMGEQCGATRHRRFEASYIWYPNGQGAPVPESVQSMPPLMRTGLAAVERAAREGVADVIDVIPDPTFGEVRVAYDGWRVLFEP